MNEFAIQIHPMVPLAKACATLKISRDELITRLSAGELMGEKRRIGESKRDSWFIYAAEFNRLMSQAVEKYEERVSTNGLEQLFTPNNKQTGKTASPRVVAPLPPPAVAATVSIKPVAVDHTITDMAEIVDALGTDYALGSEYDDIQDFRPSQTYFASALHAAPKFDLYNAAHANREEQQIGQAMVAQLMQHLQEERQTSEALKSRLEILEDEMEMLRREIISRPDARAHSPVSRVKGYFRLLLGKIT